jgi:hypothetical protein
MFDENATYHSAVNQLKDSNFIHLTSGDWAHIFKHPVREEVLRISPYDPAFHLFSRVCRDYPHPNLPHILQYQSLNRSAYVVSMPCYQAGSETDREYFINSLRQPVRGCRPAGRGAGDYPGLG